MQTLNDLARYCRNHTLEEKLLLGATTLQARLLRERLVRSGTPWLALRVGSVGSLAEGIVSSSFLPNDKIITAMLPGHAEMACRQALANSDRYASLRTEPELHAAFVDACGDLALAGIDPASLLPEDSADPGRISDLASTSVLLRESQCEHGIIDYPELLRRALDILKDHPLKHRPSILLPHDVIAALSPLELDFVHAASASAPVVMGSDADDGEGVTFRFRAAFAPEHEFRAALRELIDSGMPCDEVEFVYADANRRNELYELIVETGLPATFAEGVAVQYSKAARTLQRFLEWFRDGEPYPLIRLMYEGIPDFSAFICEGVQANRLPAAALLREARLGRDVHATLPRVDRLIEIKERDGMVRDELNVLRAARELIAAICDLLPVQTETGDVLYHDLVRGATRLVRDLCRPASPAEPQAVEGIVRMLDVHVIGPDVALPPPDAAARLLEALSSLRMPAVIKQTGGLAEQSSLPLPGHVYVTDILHAGFSGRPRVYLFGMDDESMPGHHPENPVLLDEERRRIMKRTATPLRLNHDHPRRRATLLRAFLNRCVGNVTISYARHDSSGLREKGPSPELLALFRRSTGSVSAGYRDLDAALATTACDVPRTQYASLQDWWLSLRDSATAAEFETALHRHFPMQAAGHVAELARDSALFTPYDGMTSHGGDLPVMSVTSLERLRGCPYSYFLKNVLRLRPPQHMKPTTDRWLSPMEHGSLVHRVLRGFMEAVVSEALPREGWTGRMDTLIATSLTEEADNAPPPNQVAYARTERELRKACDIFLTDELASAGSTPLAFDVAFPSDRPLPPPLKAMGEPLRLETPHGTLLLSGSIDRIDLDTDGALRIIEYKSGKERTDPSRPLAGGTMLQFAVCTEAVRLMTKPGTISNIRFFYRFLSAREQGRVTEVESFLPELRAYTGRLFDLLKRGSFPHASDPAICGSCEFAQVCRNADTTAARMKLKLDNRANLNLDAWRELRDD